MSCMELRPIYSKVLIKVEIIGAKWFEICLLVLRIANGGISYSLPNYLLKKIGSIRIDIKKERA